MDERRRLRRVAGKVICRMENMRLLAAFGGLVESVSMARISQERLSIRSARLEDVTEAVQRWQHQPVARAWERLHAYHTMCMRLKQLIHRMQSLRRVKALVRWDEETAKQRQLHMAARKVAHRWMLRARAMAWDKWCTEVRVSRVGKTAETRWSRKTTYAAWST